MSQPKFFKAEAQGDTLYIEADSLDAAKDKFRNSIGDVPESLMTWTEVDEIPEDEEAL